MRPLVFALCSALLLLGSTASAFAPVPKITVDFANEPRTRWQGPAKLALSLHGWENSFGGFFEMYLPMLDQLPTFAFDTLESVLKNRFPEQHEELHGLFEVFQEQGYLTNLNFTKFCAVPFVYELSHINTSATDDVGSGMKLPAKFAEEADKFRKWEKAIKSIDTRACTGILSLPVDPTKEIIHGRNLDESPKECRNFTLDITVVRNGTYLYNIFDYTWATTGMFTSNRVAGPTNGNQGLTMEENWRNDDNPSLAALFLRLLDPNFIPIAFLQRVIQDQQLNFTEATNFLMTATLASPGYFIVSGSGRMGAVMTLAFNKQNNRAQYINDTTASATATTGGGYGANWLVQTNYDFWKADPVDSRRWTAQRAMTFIGNHRAGTELGVWMAISTYPVHNPTTLFTALMGPDRETEGYTREAMVPVYPIYPPTE